MPSTQPTQDWNLPRDEAIPRLIEEHGGKILGLGRRICRTAEDAEDLFQETFLQAYRKWDQFEGRSAPTTWLYTIASRICQRRHRRRAGEPVRMESLEELLPYSEKEFAVDTADDIVERADDTSRVAEAISALPLSFRLPILLKDIAELSIADVARILEIKQATVKTRVHRARLKLRKELERGRRRRPAGKAYSREVCLDLLMAKQEALDHGVAMPGQGELICERCAEVFASMDRTRDVCSELGGDRIPDSVRAEIARRLAEED